MARTDVAQGSLLLTLAGLACIVGSITSGFILDVFGRPLILMGSAALLNAALAAAIPLCESFPLMVTVNSFFAFNTSIIDIGQFSYIFGAGYLKK